MTTDNEERPCDVATSNGGDEPFLGYVLDEQVGFLLRKAYQRHMTIFARSMIGGLTPTQFSTLFRLFAEPGPISQNALGRLVAMDAATTKGVISRLEKQGLITTERDTEDKRRYVLQSTAKGQQLIREAIPVVKGITEATLDPLTKSEREMFLKLLAKLC
ncbi:MarR family transcriptional regulator [Jiella endophytica]|uniref:MarR family transcriptional regulator n=1 Tax=Jiella endophytica TaxID=2558362 RepID=A0A4Y8RJN7_9HYPH|nr:MarR family transcriptional regulator [Jiella endophytica]